MDAFTAPQLLASGILVLLAGMAIGWGFSRFLGSRPDDSGKVEQLETELSSYKQEVNEHFQQTATLLQEMTDRYKTIYEHMADGARSFCDADATKLQHLQGGLLTAAIDDTPDSDSGAEDQSETLTKPENTAEENNTRGQPV